MNFFKLLFCCLILFPFTTSIQGQFSNEAPIIEFPVDTRDHIVTDFDQDGLNDVLVFRLAAVSWYRNTGEGVFEPEQVLKELDILEGYVPFSTQPNYSGRLCDSDLDGDEDIFLVPRFGSSTILLMENTGGAFSDPVGLLPKVDIFNKYASDITFLDTNGDGLQEIIVSVSNQNIGTSGLYTMQNLGNNSFGGISNIPETVQGLWSCDFNVADMDNDGVHDLIIIPTSWGLKWKRNLGNGQFGPMQDIFYQPLSSFKSDRDRVAIADLDGDGDMDAVAASWAASPVYLMFNEGNGEFGDPVVLDNVNAYHLVAGDFDFDGLPDIALHKFVTYYVRELIWYHNTGDGMFDAHEPLNSELEGESLIATDLNNDLHTDLVFADRVNIHSLIFQPDQETFESGVLNQFVPDGLTDICMADIDGNGYTDIISICSSIQHVGFPMIGEAEIAWYPNYGEQPFGSQRTIHSFSGDAVSAGDLDGDNDIDIVAVSEVTDSIAWFENSGLDEDFERHDIDVMQWGSDITVMDGDSDGLTDMVVAGRYEIRYYHNLGNGTFDPTILYTWPGVITSPEVAVADEDNDGDDDILSIESTSLGIHQIVWYINDGMGEFVEKRYVASSYHDGADCGDMDGDGDIDVLARGSSIHWFERIGAGNYITHDLDPGTLGDLYQPSRMPECSDMDGDGILDILIDMPAYSINRYDYIRMTGDGNYVLPDQSDYSPQNSASTRKILSIDADNDGDKDMVGFFHYRNEITWKENIAGDGCTDSLACNYDPNAFVNDGTCCYGVCGCTEVGSCNYDPSADCNDGNCIPGGCIAEEACNYDPLAQCETLVCTYPGCTQPEACNFDPEAGCDDGSCEEAGCMDEAACNFNANAFCDNGSCVYPLCDDPLACNYTPEALCGGGDCDFSCYGCMDTAAYNFDTEATVDDGSCLYCYADLDDNGVVDVGDLNILLTAFGCTGTCIADIDGNGSVGSGDIFILIAQFGLNCP